MFAVSANNTVEVFYFCFGYFWSKFLFYLYFIVRLLVFCYIVLVVCKLECGLTDRSIGRACRGTGGEANGRSVCPRN